jgi:hypothetical protein
VTSGDWEPFPTCGSLREIKLVVCQLLVDMVDRLLQACPGLVTLEIGGCMSLRGDQEDQNLTISHHSRALQRLVLDGHRPGFCEEEILLAIAEHCPDLRALEYSGSFYLDGAGVAAVIRQCPLLQELRTSLRADILSAILQSGYNLRVLYLNSCGLSDEGVAQIMQACSALEELAVHCSPECAQEIRSRYPRTRRYPHTLDYLKRRCLRFHF